MSVIATVTVPPESFALGETLTANPNTRIRLDRVVPTGGSLVPYFWASDDAVEAIEANLQRAADIASFTVVDRTNGSALVRVSWEPAADGLLEAIAESGANVLEGVGEHDRWRLQLRFDDHDGLSAFFRRCSADGIPLEVENVHNPGIYHPHDVGAGLSDAQREALQLAVAEGYFAVPRRVTLVELAEELGISDSAVSQRLRRAIATVLEESAIDGERPPGDG